MRIRILAPEIIGLQSLRKIISVDNPIESIPNEISKLVNLEYINFDYNQLQSIPEDIYRLKRLNGTSTQG